MRGVQSEHEALEMAKRINGVLADPFDVAGQKVGVRVSTGIGLSNSGYEQGEDLLRDAGTALVQAKDTGRGQHTVFAPPMRRKAVDRLALDQSLREAVHDHQFIAYYQPIISIETGRLVGLESLARWKHPTRGILAPAEFLSRATETGLLSEISWHVMIQACEQQRRWIDALGPDAAFSVSVNVSPTLLMRRGFVEDVQRLLSDLRLTPQRVKAEITEVVAIDDTGASAETIQALRRFGLVVCLDDFGTGYASLSWLHRFPVDEIKIDQTFVREMVEDRKSQILVGAAVTLAHSLGLSVVGEGVETAEQLAELRALGCEYAQGFLFDRPMAVDRAGELLRRQAG